MDYPMDFQKKALFLATNHIAAAVLLTSRPPEHLFLTTHPAVPPTTIPTVVSLSFDILAATIPRVVPLSFDILAANDTAALLHRLRLQSQAALVHAFEAERVGAQQLDLDPAPAPPSPPSGGEKMGPPSVRPGRAGGTGGRA